MTDWTPLLRAGIHSNAFRTLDGRVTLPVQSTGLGQPADWLIGCLPGFQSGVSFSDQATKQSDKGEPVPLYNPPVRMRFPPAQRAGLPRMASVSARNQQQTEFLRTSGRDLRGIRARVLSAFAPQPWLGWGLNNRRVTSVDSGAAAPPSRFPGGAASADRAGERLVPPGSLAREDPARPQ